MVSAVIIVFPYLMIIRAGSRRIGKKVDNIRIRFRDSYNRPVVSCRKTPGVISVQFVPLSAERQIPLFVPFVPPPIVVLLNAAYNIPLSSTATSVYRELVARKLELPLTEDHVAPLSELFRIAPVAAAKTSPAFEESTTIFHI